ncbi:MAG: YitT family protein [Clostridia bacterium]|nr:YitT family protein [Clostridia bacterium]
MTKIKSKKGTIKKYLSIVLGCILVGFAIGVFYTPNKVVGGGVSGISTILFHTLGVPVGVSFAVINILLLLISLKKLGKRFFFNTIIGSLLVSVFAEVFTLVPPITKNVFLASVFGSVLYGFGIGLTLVSGASTGGTDVLGRLVQASFPYIKIGKLLMVIDGIVIATSLVLFREIDLALYGIIALFLATAAIDWLIQSLNISKLAFIVSDKGLEISHKLTSVSPRGVTIINAKGGYTMDNKTVLMCALKENEMEEFQRRVLEMDSTAFIIFSESQQIIGNGFRVYK